MMTTRKEGTIAAGLIKCEKTEEKKKNLKKEKILTRASGTTAIFLNFNVDSVINDSFQTSQCIDMKNRDISNNTRRNP